MMNKNFETIIFLAGKFGIVIREHIQELVYTNKYSAISANRTLTKLVDGGYLKRIDRGKRKSDGYKLAKEGIKYYKKNFGKEPKNYNSGDKLQHSIQILSFYINMIDDLKIKYNIEEIEITEEKRVFFQSEKQLKYNDKDKVASLIPDAFSIYRYKPDRARVFYLEIENSNRNPAFVAKKTLDNYEKYYISKQWTKESWQRKDKKIFPYILIVSYSEYKSKELIRNFKKKIKVDKLENNYYFTDYKTIKENGISGDIWRNINNELVSLF